MVRRILSLLTNREKLKKFMDWMAYGSLFFDICITIITLSSLFYPNNLEQYLGSVNILLSIIVVFSITSAVLMIGSKIYEQMFFRPYRFKYGMRNRLSKFKNRIYSRKYWVIKLFTPANILQLHKREFLKMLLYKRKWK